MFSQFPIFRPTPVILNGSTGGGQLTVYTRKDHSLGWGPGTYQEVYAPYQLSVDRTIITTNFGDMEMLIVSTWALLPNQDFPE
jgi:hypothetical protein